MQSWILYALTCMCLWGTGYTILSPVSKTIPNDVISITYGACLCLVNLLYNLVNYRVEAFYILADAQTSGYLFGYVTLFVLSNFIYLKGNQLATQESANAPYTAICGLYPVVTLILSVIFLGQRNLNWLYIGPGMVCIVTGVVLLALGKST